MLSLWFVWCSLPSLGAMPTIYLSFFLILIFTVTVHITVHSNPNLGFHFVSSPNPTIPFPLRKSYNLFHFLAYSPPKPKPNSSKLKLYKISKSSKSGFVCSPLPYDNTPLATRFITNYPNQKPFSFPNLLKISISHLRLGSNSNGAKK